MILVFGLVIGLWETLAGGFLPSIGGEQGLGLQEKKQKCDHWGQNLITGYHRRSVIITLDSQNYFLIRHLVFERWLLTSVYHFKPSCVLSKLPQILSRDDSYPLTSPGLPRWLPPTPAPSLPGAVTRHQWWKSPAGQPWREWPNTLGFCTLCWYTCNRIWPYFQWNMPKWRRRKKGF